MAELSVTALTDTILVTLNRADRAARIRRHRPGAAAMRVAHRDA
jgi:hypothetical protein